MRVTRRFWLITTAIVCLTVSGGLLDAPLLIVVAAGLAGWVLAMQIAFVHAVFQLTDALTVDQSLNRSRIRTDVETAYRLEVSVEIDGDHLPLSVRATIPLAAQTETTVTPTVDLDQSIQSSSITIPLTWQTVGEHTFPGATVTASGTSGLFTQSFTTDPGPETTVESPSLGPIHVGQGSKQLLRGVGEHDAHSRTGGLSAEEVRKYVPGDALKYVDWKATARLDEAHVRNYEAESNRRTVLIVNHRRSMGAGPPGETKLDYLKAIATAFRQRSESVRDPLGYLTIDDTGVTGAMSPAARPKAYESFRHCITDLTVDAEQTSTTVTSPDQTGSVSHAVSPTPDTQSPIERTVLAYRTASGATRRIPDQPMYNGLQAAQREIRTADLVVICTDDSNPSELRDTVGLARRNTAEVIVFITPSAAFEPNVIADLDTAYERYRTFDQFRRKLTEMESVTAYEVGSPDQIQSILASGSATTKQEEYA